MITLRKLRTVRVQTLAFDPRLEKSEKPQKLDTCGITFFTTHIHYMLLTISYSESAYPIGPVVPLKTRFRYKIETCLLFSRKQHKYFYHMFLTIRAPKLARGTRVVIHSIFVLGPSALGMGESYL